MTEDNNSFSANGRRYREISDVFQAVKAAEGILKAADEVHSLYAVHVPAMKRTVMTESMHDVCLDIIRDGFKNDSSILPEEHIIKTLGAICVDDFSKGARITRQDGKTKPFFSECAYESDSMYEDDVFFEYKSIHAARYFKENIKPVCECNPLYRPLNNIEENSPLLNRALGLLYLAESYEMREKNGMTDKISGLKPAEGYFVPLGTKYADGFRIAAIGIMSEAEEYLKGRGYKEEADEISSIRSCVIVSGTDTSSSPVLYADRAVFEHKRMTHRYNEQAGGERILTNNKRWLNKIRFCRDLIKDGTASFQNYASPVAKP